MVNNHFRLCLHNASHCQNVCQFRAISVQFTLMRSPGVQEYCDFLLYWSYRWKKTPDLNYHFSTLSQAKCVRILVLLIYVGDDKIYYIDRKAFPVFVHWRKGNLWKIGSRIQTMKTCSTPARANRMGLISNSRK